MGISQLPDPFLDLCGQRPVHGLEVDGCFAQENKKRLQIRIELEVDRHGKSASINGLCCILIGKV